MSTQISTVIIDQDRYRWPGSGSVVTTGSCPFDFYTTDAQFNSECYKSAKWAAERLGYPAVDIEMLDINFYGCYEEAVSEYAAQVNQYNIKNNYLSLLGQPISQSLNGISGKQFFSESYRLVKDRTHLILSPLNIIYDKKELLIPEKTSEIKLPLNIKFKTKNITDDFVFIDSKNIAFFDYDKLNFPLKLRKWKEGDFFYPLGMKGKKKLSR